MALTCGDGRYARILKSLGRTELLILDDFGLEPLDANARHDLLEILEERYGRRSTIVTSQLPIPRWHTVIGDTTYADAIMDRLNVSPDAVMNLVGLGFGVSFTSEAGTSRHYADVSIKPIRGVGDRLAYQGDWRPQNDNPAFCCFLSLVRSKSKERKCA